MRGPSVRRARLRAVARVGVLRGAEDLLGGPALDDAAALHHRDGVADLPHHREVVRDEEVAEPELALQLLEQLEDLRLHGDVERRDGLVEHDDLGFDRERPGDRDPLPLAARELARARAASTSAGSATRSTSSPHAPGARRAVARPKLRSGSATISRDVCRGSSDENGFW